MIQISDYDSKISEMEKKYLTTSDYNNLAHNTIDANIKEKKLVNESDIADFMKKTYFDDKLKNIIKKFTD